MISFTRLAEAVRDRLPAAVVTVTSTKGSTPRKAGSKMLVIDDGTSEGKIEGTIGGGAVEHEVRRRALACIATTTTKDITLALTTELGMCCGGTMTVFVEPIRQRPPLIIFGAGHVGQSLADVAHAMGFDVVVADPRDELRQAVRFPHATLIDGYDEEDFARLPFGKDAFVVVVTHDHAADQMLVERALTHATRYIAMIGSRRKAAMTRERCAAKGFSSTDIDRIVSPAGLDIGAETPEEIALSIVAQMVSIRRSRVIPDAVIAASHDGTRP